MMLEKLVSRVPVDKIIERDFSLTRSGRYLRGKKHNSLVIDTEKNYFYWNSLGISGNALDWLIKIKGLSYRDALGILQQYSGLPFTRLLERVDKPNKIYPKLLNVFFNLGKRYREYWYARGLTDATIAHFKLGFTGRHYVIPVITNGELYNFQCRLGTGEDKRVWNWASKSPTIFNLDGQCGDTVFLTEGMPDAMILYQMDMPAICQSSGITWKPEWNKFIVHLNTIYVIFDNDRAGIVGARRTASKLLNKAYVLFWPDFTPEKFDINQCYLTYGEELTRQIIKEAMMPEALHSSDFNKIAKAGRYDIIGDIQETVSWRTKNFM